MQPTAFNFYVPAAVHPARADSPEFLGKQKTPSQLRITVPAVGSSNGPRRWVMEDASPSPSFHEDTDTAVIHPAKTQMLSPPAIFSTSVGWSLQNSPDAPFACDKQSESLRPATPAMYTTLFGDQPSPSPHLLGTSDGTQEVSQPPVMNMPASPVGLTSKVRSWLETPLGGSFARSSPKSDPALLPATPRMKRLFDLNTPASVEGQTLPSLATQSTSFGTHTPPRRVATASLYAYYADYHRSNERATTTHRSLPLLTVMEQEAPELIFSQLSTDVSFPIPVETVAGNPFVPCVVKPPLSEPTWPTQTLQDEDELYVETAAALPAYGNESLRLLRQLALTQHWPSFRQQVIKSYASWPHQEQEEVFSQRRWASFMWLAFGALVEEAASDEDLFSFRKDIFRQAQVYLVTGGGNALAAFIDYAKERYKLPSYRPIVMSSQAVQSVARRWWGQKVQRSNIISIKSQHRPSITKVNTALRISNDKNICSEIAMAIPVFGDRALKIMMKVNSSLERLTLRRQMVDRWSKWPLSEQSIVFDCWPWADFVWIAFSAAAENDFAVENLDSSNNNFFGFACAFFVVGGGPALEAFLKSYRKTHRHLYVSLRKKTMNHASLRERVAKWQDEGMLVQSGSTSSRPRHKERYQATASALPEFADAALELLKNTVSLPKKMTTRWSAWSRHEQKQVFSDRPWAEFVWLALGSIAEQGVNASEFSSDETDFFTQSMAYFLAGGGRGLGAYIDYDRALAQSRGSLSRNRVLRHPAVTSLVEKWQQEGIQLNGEWRALQQYTVDSRYSTLCNAVPEFSARALSIWNQAKNSRLWPPLRRQLKNLWILWPRNEQQAVFTVRPWARVVWLALGAMAEDNVYLESFSPKAREFLRYAQSYFVAGGGPALAAFLDYDHGIERPLQNGLTYTVELRADVSALSARWQREGVLQAAMATPTNLSGPSHTAKSSTRTASYRKRSKLA